MGLFDTVRSSYNIGEQFTNVELQTKDIECSMSDYWISPAGQLYLIDYSHTADFVEIPENSLEYNKKLSFLNFKWIPNGNHGKVRPHMITKYICAYPAVWKGNYDDWPEIIIHFRYGKLQDYVIKSKLDK